MLASLALFFGNMASLALDVLLCLLLLALYGLIVLWLLNRLPARLQAVLNFLSSLLAPEDAAPPARSPARPLSAPAPASAPPPPSARLPSASCWHAGTPQTLAWERRSISAPSSLVDRESVARFAAWYERRVHESRPKKTVRFAPEAQVQTIPSRHSVAHPEPVSAVAPPPVAEPWDAAAWSARLEAFSKAIHMPNCSLLPDPKLVLAPAAPAQQQFPVWRPEIVQQAPAAPGPAPSPPKAPAPPPPSAPGPATAAPCEPKMPQQAPPPPPPPKPFSSAPAATPMQDPSAAAKVPAPTKPPAASTTATNTSAVMSQTGGFSFAVANPMKAVPEGLTEAQQKHRERMQRALQVLDDIKADAASRRGTSREQNLTAAWCEATKGTTKQMKMQEIARELQVVFDVARNDMGDLNETVMPRALLEKMLLKGAKFDEMLDGFRAGEGMLRDAAGGWDGMLAMRGIPAVLLQMQGFFARYPVRRVVSGPRGW